MMGVIFLAVTPQRTFVDGDESEMIRIATKRNVAAMLHELMPRNWAVEHLPNGTMRSHGTTANHDQPVSLAVDRSSPKQAPCIRLWDRAVE